MGFYKQYLCYSTGYYSEEINVQQVYVDLFSKEKLRDSITTPIWSGRIGINSEYYENELDKIVEILLDYYGDNISKSIGLDYYLLNRGWKKQTQAKKW